MRLRVLAFVLGFGVALAAAEPGDPAHDEMATALEAQIDVHPAAASLPTATVVHVPTAARTASSTSNGNSRVHGPGNGQGQGQANAILHQAEGAANSAVGQERAEQAQARAKMHPHPGH